MSLFINSKADRFHFAFDFMKYEKQIIKGLEIFRTICKPIDNKAIVYILTNYDTSISEDLYRLKKVVDLGYLPDVRIYRKPSAPQILKDLQRWCNNRFLFRSCDFMEYIPRKDGKTIRQLYFS